MWDRPDLLNPLASALYAVAAALALYGAAAALVNLPVFPLREVRVVEPPAHVTRAQVEAIVKSELRGNFFTLDLPRRAAPSSGCRGCGASTCAATGRTGWRSRSRSTCRSRAGASTRS